MIYVTCTVAYSTAAKPSQPPKKKKKKRRSYNSDESTEQESSEDEYVPPGEQEQEGTKPDSADEDEVYINSTPHVLSHYYISWLQMLSFVCLLFYSFLGFVYSLFDVIIKNKSVYG